MKDFDLIGVIHFPKQWWEISSKELEKWLKRNIDNYVNGGINKIILQEQTIEKESSIQIISHFTAVCKFARDNYLDIEFGIILDSNDCEAALNICDACDFNFVRIKVFVGAMIKATGIVQGCGYKVGNIKEKLKNKIKIMADIYDRTGDPIGNIPIETAGMQAVKLGADELIVTGSSVKNSLLLSSKVKEKNKDAKVFVGGGVNSNNLLQFYEYLDGAIVNSCLLKDGYTDEWDLNKIKILVNQLQ